MGYEFEVSDVLPGTSEAISRAWMSGEGHTAMTGAGARVDPRVGGEFEAWDGYTIRHTNVPDGQLGYEQGGWQENYFDPMRVHFARGTDAARPPTP